ncbi:MAG TPA: DUF935 domain-containing protein, partial [Nevskiales bacterium]|nr:DUF935 domain-containing protein [Nevskiales bacterium]
MAQEIVNSGRILGPDGLPIRREQLTREIATPSLTGVRQIWTSSIASGLTPEDLVSILQRAVENDAHDFLTLAEEMEERETHYGAVLGVRKQAVTGLDIIVESASDKTADVKLADEIRALIADPAFDDMTEDLMDALGKSYSAVEIMWDRSERQWRPRAYEHRDPRWFRFDRETGSELRLLDEVDFFNGIPLPAYKFITHRPRIKTGLPIRSGLARMAAFAWICKAYALKDWMAFAEVFGLPITLGKYGPGATAEDVAVLRAAVANIGSDARAVLPESMKIEFEKTAAAAGGDTLFEKLCEYLDRQMSKAVLGQTSTTDAQAAGLGSNQASVHNQVRGDIIRADARRLANTLNRDLVKPYIDLNHGPQEHYPTIRIHIPEPEDLQQLTAALKDLVPMGLRVETSVIRDKLGLPDPAKDAEVLTAPAAAVAPAVNHHQGCPHCGTARNAASD